MGAITLTMTNDHARGKRRRPGRPAAHTPIGQGETRDLVLRQARRLFMRRGYADVSVGEVAEAVGVTKPTLYYHFADKEGLYAAVLSDLMSEVGGYVRRAAAQPVSVRERLVEIAYGFFLHSDFTMEPMLRDATYLIGPERAERVQADYTRHMLDPLLRLMREGVRAGEVRADTDAPTLVRAYLGLLDSFTAPDGHAARSDAEHRRAAQTLVTLFLDGATPRR